MESRDLRSRVRGGKEVRQGGVSEFSFFGDPSGRFVRFALVIRLGKAPINFQLWFDSSRKPRSKKRTGGVYAQARPERWGVGRAGSACVAKHTRGWTAEGG